MSDYTDATAKEADILNSVNPTVKLSDGSEVVILKCKLKQIGDVLRFLAFLMNAIGMKDLSDNPDLDLQNPTDLMILIADSSEEIYPVASSLCSLSQNQFEDLDIDDAMDIMLAEWELNKDFFLQKVMPRLSKPTTPPGRTSKAPKRKKNTRKKRAS